MISSYNTNSQFNKTISFQMNGAKVRNIETGEVINSDLLDNQLYKRNSIIGGSLGAVVGLIASEMIPAETAAMKMRNRILAPILVAAGFVGLAFQDKIVEKFSGKVGVLSAADKANYYKSKGYELLADPELPQNKEIERSNNINKTTWQELAFVGLGAAMAVTKALTNYKLKLPTMQWGFADSNAVNAVADGLGNALIYGIVAKFAKAIFFQPKVNSNEGSN